MNWAIIDLGAAGNGHARRVATEHYGPVQLRNPGNRRRFQRQIGVFTVTGRRGSATMGRAARARGLLLTLALCATPPALRGAQTWHFDMGTGTSPVFPGFEQVTKEMVYSQERGHGWQGERLGEGHRDVPDALGCDFVLGPGTFRLNVPNGRYAVWVLLGDSGHGINHPRFWHLPYRIKANGEAVVSVVQTVEGHYREYYFSNLYADCQPGESLWEKYLAKYDRAHTFDVDVSNEHLQVEFSSHVPINALAVYPSSAADELKQAVAKWRGARRKQFDEAFRLAPPEKLSPGRAPTPLEKERGYVLMHRPSVESIYPHTRPEPGERLTNLSVFATPGEHEPIIFSVWPLEDLDQAEVAVSPLRGPGDAVLPTQAMVKSYVKFVERRGRRRDSYEISPRTLLPYRPIDLHRDVTKRFWLTLHVPQGQAPGEYRGEIRFRPKGRPATAMPLQVTVLPFELVKAPGISYGMYYYTPDSTVYRNHGARGKPPSRSAWAQEQVMLLTEADLRDQVAHGMNCAAMDPAWNLFRVRDEQVLPDEDAWQWYGRLMDLYLASGMTKPLPAYSISFILSLSVPDRVQPKDWEVGGRFTERFERLYAEIIRQYYERAHAQQAKGRWPEVVFYASDELSNYSKRGADWGRTHLELLNRVKQSVPGGFRTCASINGPPERALLPLLDVAIPNNSFPINSQTLDTIRGRGCELWLYNIGLHRFTWGFYLIKTGAKGRLQWHYRCNPRGTCDPHNWLTSSSYAMVDTTPNGVLPTCDWENVREGVDDARYVRTLEQCIARARTSKRPEAIAAAARAQGTLDWLLDNTSADLSCYRTEVGYWDPATFDELRWRIAQEILNVQSAVRVEAARENAPWWDRTYAHRVPATVNTLFWARRDALVRVKVDFSSLLKEAGELDRNSVRLVLPAEPPRLVPSQVTFADGDQAELCWTVAGKREPLSEELYHIYFDTMEHGPKPRPAQVEIPGAGRRPGENRVKNAGFEEADPDDPARAAHWDFGNRTPDAACRTDEESHSGRWSLKVVIPSGENRTFHSVSQVVPAVPGKKYVIRGWIKAKTYERGTAGVWAWYQFPKRQTDYSNYKTSATRAGPEAWTEASGSWINVYDRALGQNVRIPATLPGTVAATISPGACYGGMVVYIDDVEFYELDRDALRPLEVKLGKPETLGSLERKR